MKIRIKGNSIRLRLTKPEVAVFCKEGRYEEAIHFGGRQLIYALVAKPGIDTPEATYVGDTITVYLMREVQDTWYHSDKIGYSTPLQHTTTDSLAILVEKDFTCMDNTVEDQSDMYPNPKM